MAPETGNGAGEANRNTVFIDTSLDTHLATIVSDSDTVSDLKQKMVLEHRQCFPAIGDINIQCLKVKRRGNFYHLAESMLVKSAFGSANKNWFLSADISHIEQNHGIQNMNKHEIENQLALPWVTDCRSIDKQNSHTDKSNQFLLHGSSSMHHKLVPFVNQKVPNVDQLTSGDSCKDVSKNIEENRSFNDDDLEKQLDSKVLEKPLTVNNEIISKKRTRDVNNENLSENVSVKKKRKTQKIEVNLKASEKDVVLTYDENSVENKSKSKDLSDENTKINKDLSVEDVGIETNTQKNTEESEIVPEIATVVEQNIEQEMPLGISQKEKDDEIVHKKVIGNEIPSSSMRTSDSEQMGPLTTTVMNNIRRVKDTVAMSQQELGSNGQESAVDQIDKNKETMYIENTVEGKKKKVKKSAVRKKDKSLVKHADNISSTVSVPIFDEKIIDEKKKKIIGDVSSTVYAPVSDEKIIDEKNENLSLLSAEKNEVSEKTITDNANVKELEILEPTKSDRSQVHVENMEEKSNNELKAIVGIRKKKKVGKSAKKNNETVVMNNSDAAIVTNEEKVLPQNDDILMENNAEISKIEKNVSQVNAEVINDKLEKVNEKTDGKEKIRKKKKSKKIAEENSKNLTVSEVSKVTIEEKTDDSNNKIDIPNDKSHDIDFKEYFSPSQQPNKIDSVENRKDAKLTVSEKKLKKKTKEPIPVETSIQSQKTFSKNENKKPLLSSKKNVVKDPTIPNISEVKTPKITTSDASSSRSESFGRSLQSQKVNKPRSILGQTQVKTVKKNPPAVKRLLNTAGTIFGDDSDSSSADDNATKISNSSTRTPSRNSSSSEESQSPSIDSRRNGSRLLKRKEGGGKNSINSQSRMKNVSMADLLRSSSRFKKAKLTASQVDDTESQPVDFVPDSQPMGNR